MLRKSFSWESNIHPDIKDTAIQSSDGGDIKSPTLPFIYQLHDCYDDKYREFKRNAIPYDTLFIGLIVCSVLYTLLFIVSVLYPISGYALITYSTWIFVLFSLIPGWLCMYKKYIPQSMLWLCKDSLITVYMNFHIVALCWSLLVRLYVGNCVGCTGMRVFECNPYHAAQSMPPEHVLLLTITLFAFHLCLDRSFLELLIPCSLVYATLFVGMLMFSNLSSFPILAIFPLCVYVIFLSERCTFRMYTLKVRLEELVQGKTVTNSYCRDDQTDHHLKEVQYIIGNIAHDLKTPMQALTMGVDEVAALNQQRKEIISSAKARAKAIASGKVDLDRVNEPLYHYEPPNKESYSASTRGATAELNEAIQHLRTAPTIIFDQLRAKVIEANAMQMSEVLQSLRDTSSFMMMNINRAIDYSKSSNGVHLVPTMDTVNIISTLHWAVNCVRRLQDRIPIIIDPIPNSHVLNPYVITDRNWFIDNILCLVSNAVKFTTEGEVRISVCVEDATVPSIEEAGASDLSPFENSSFSKNSSAENKKIKIVVQDSGIGVPSEKKGSLFQPFIQAQRMAGGTGLGLYSLAKRVAALHGSYGLCDRPDGHHGSYFWFDFPYLPDPLRLQEENEMEDNSVSASPLGIKPKDILMSSSIDKQNHEVESAITGGEKPWALQEHDEYENMEKEVDIRMKLLLVDDSIVIQKTLKRRLEKKGFTVYLADNGLQGLQMAKEFDYGVILLDMNMPVMDGYECCRRIRDYEKSVNINQPDASKRARQIIIGVSANSASDTRAYALSAGMDDFISKPFSIDKFCSVYDSMRLDKPVDM